MSMGCIGGVSWVKETLPGNLRGLKSYAIGIYFEIFNIESKVQVGSATLSFLAKQIDYQTRY